MKFGRLNEPFGPPWEPTLQTYEIPLSAFAARDAAFDPSTIRRIVFSPDRQQGGRIALDGVGLRLDR